MNRTLLLPLTAALLGACSGDDQIARTPVNVPDGGMPSEPQGGLAVVASDYKSTSISLIDPVTGIVLRDNCINSGTASPNLSLLLSGDVTLPSSVQPGHELLLVDRQNAALTWLDPTTCKVKRQMSVGTGFPSNPHDVLPLSASKAYVTRHDRNPKPTENPDDRDDGDDILIIDPTAATVTGRINLAPFAATVGEKALWARPDRAILADGKVYVTLAHLNGDFSAAGSGRILVIDPATDTVGGMIELPGLKGCLGLSYLAGNTTLVVTCAGDFNDLVQTDGSAVVTIDISASPPAVTVRVPSAAFGGQPLSLATPGALTPDSGLVVAMGAFKVPPPDRLWTYEASGAPATLLEAKESFVFGDLLSDAGRQQIFFADATASKPRVHIIDVSGAPRIASSIDPSPATGLPPRSLGWY